MHLPGDGSTSIHASGGALHLHMHAGNHVAMLLAGPKAPVRPIFPASPPGVRPQQCVLFAQHKRRVSLRGGTVPSPSRTAQLSALAAQRTARAGAAHREHLAEGPRLDANRLIPAPAPALTHVRHAVTVAGGARPPTPTDHHSTTDMPPPATVSGTGFPVLASPVSIPDVAKSADKKRRC